MSTIGGRVDVRGLALLTGQIDAAEYRERAQRHRPGAAGIEAEGRRLLQAGLRPRDVAQALRVGEAQVLEWARRSA